MFLIIDTDALYQVVFVKTHFVNVTVGQDHGADITFHYPQVKCCVISACFDPITGIGKVY